MKTGAGYSVSEPTERMKMEKGKVSKHDLKPDKLKHEGHNVFKSSHKKDCLPGQQYVPKKVHNESDFAGDEKQHEFY